MRNRRQRHWGRVAASLLSLCLVAACTATSERSSPAPDFGTDDLAEEVALALDAWLTDDRLYEAQVPGAASVVVTRDGVVRERVYGITGGPGSPPVTPDTLFCIRSISKSVTTVAVLMAVQDGLLDLDAPISEYLPEFTVRSRFEEHPEDRITLGRMLSHWSGFTHDPPQDLDLTRPDYFDRYIETIPDSWLRFPVGYRHHYSNYGIDLAAHLIESRAGIAFPDYVRDKVLEPIGMTLSSFDLAAVEAIEDRARGFDIEGNPAPLHFPEIPSAGLYASIRDMARYARFHLNEGVVDGRRLLREDLMDQAHSIQFPARGQRTGYCFGLVREVVADTYSLSHEGGGRGFGARMMLYPELGFGVVILTNREYHGLTGTRARDVVNGRIVERLGPTPVDEPGTDAMPRLDPGDQRIESILGRYGDSPGYVVGFDDGVLGLRTSEGRFEPLTFHDDGGQLVGMYDATREVRFLPAYGNRPGAMMLVDRRIGNANLEYRDFNDAPDDLPGPDRPEWQRYVGEYDVLWAGIQYASASVTVRNGYLYFRDGKCEEFEPGRFFYYDGEVLDLAADPPTFANSVLRRKGPKVE